MLIFETSEIEQTLIPLPSSIQCQTEWFHFACVNLREKPKNKWYCRYDQLYGVTYKFFDINAGSLSLNKSGYLAARLQMPLKYCDSFAEFIEAQIVLLKTL